MRSLGRPAAECEALKTGNWNLRSVMEVEKRLIAVRNVLGNVSDVLGNVSEGPMKLRLSSARRERQAQTQQATFEALVEGCWEALWRYAYHTTGNRDDAEDLLSEALVDGFRSFGQFRGDTPFVRW